MYIHESAGEISTRRTGPRGISSLRFIHAKLLLVRGVSWLATEN
jgi:hypothetical protein